MQQVARPVLQRRHRVHASDTLNYNPFDVLNLHQSHRYYTKQGLVPADLKGSFSMENFPDIKIDGKQVRIFACAVAVAHTSLHHPPHLSHLLYITIPPHLSHLL